MCSPRKTDHAMASGAIPPRQKMINMMYLVLTAMLALNVSKEVLDAFAYMDADLVRSERAHEQRSMIEYGKFAKAAAENPEKFGAKHEQALRVKAQADALIERIEMIKTQAIAIADGHAAGHLRAPDGSGRDTLRALIALGAKDDRTTLTRMLVGSDPGFPRTDPGSATELKREIAAFRDSLITLAQADPALTEAIALLFDLNDRRDASGTWNNWESFNFYDVPLAAGIATLSKLGSDVRSAENDIVKWLYGQVEEKDYKFGTLTTAVIPQSNLIMLGDSFRADVFLAAYDPLNRPQVLADGVEVPVGADGKAKLRLKGDGVGEHLVEGSIRFLGPDGPEEIPYSTRFQVMPPVLVASPTKMNVLYRGVENPLDISVPGVPADKVQATTSNGRITRTAQGWVVTGLAPGSAEVNAVVIRPDGSARRVGPMVFRVKDLPPPVPSVAGRKATDRTVRKQELVAALGISAMAEDSPFEDRFLVKSFQVTVIRRDGVVNSFPLTGNRFDQQVKAMFETLRTHERVIFEDIRAKLSSGQGREYHLPNITLTVVN